MKTDYVAYGAGINEYNVKKKKKKLCNDPLSFVLHDLGIKYWRSWPSKWL